jgi:transcription elongation GreA/GreB family factor
MAAPRKAPKTVSKQALKDELVALVTQQLETMVRSHRAATEGATHEEAKPEDDKDTRALEQSYLARGQAARAEQLQASLAALMEMPVRACGSNDAVAVGALVALEDEEERKLTVYVVSAGGGNRLAQGTVQTATPQSPLGEALIGKRAGDSFELKRGGHLDELTIVSVV